MAVTRVYDGNACPNCPSLMPCLCSVCQKHPSKNKRYEIKMICDVCGEETDTLHRNAYDKFDLCDECYEKYFVVITGDNAYEYCD